MDAAGGGVDVGMAQKGLHHRQVDAGFGQRRAERVPQRVRMRGRDAGQAAVVAQDAPQNNRVLVVSGRSASR